MNSAKELREHIAARGIKSVAATEALFERIEAYEPVIGAYISTFKEDALARADEIDAKIAAGRQAENPKAVEAVKKGDKKSKKAEVFLLG